MDTSRVIVISPSELDEIVRRATLAVIADLREDLQRQEREIMSKIELAEYLGVSPATINRLMNAPDGVPFYRIAPNAHPLFRRSEIDAWISNKQDARIQTL
jgi:predicted DNA-binding transcriptional regulator AlpA